VQPQDPLDELEHFGRVTPDLACVIDAEGRFVAANPAWKRVLGLRPDELLGRSILELVHEDDLDRTLGILDQVVAGQVLSDFVNRYPHADGGWRWVSWSAAKSPNAGRVHAAGRDITDRVELQLRTARSAVDLGLELSAEREATDELRRLDQRKDTHLAAAAHDLRTPLMVVQGAAETLANRRDTLSTDEIARFEHVIVTHVARLGRVVDDLLDVSRNSRAWPHAATRRTDLVGLVTRVCEESSITDRIELIAPDDFELEVDPVQIEHIVSNLLENAAKYAPRGPVVVTIDQTDDSVRIAVRDQGPGIPLAALEHVFEPFWRGPSDRATPGSGMGLSLVAEFARLHGGRAWAEPTHRGAHLVVELPVVRT
jgi:PAS domain S-box-containing protein